MKTDFSELKNKEVVNVKDGKLLGCVCDLELDTCDGRVLSIILPGSGIFASFSSKNHIVIPWCNIEKIGEDAILVRYCEALPSGK